MTRRVLAPVGGKILTGVVGALALGSLVVIVVQSGPEAGLSVVAPLALLAVGTWALFWRPAVILDEEGVTLRNPVRTVLVPWGGIRDVDTRFALALATERGTITAWAAPAPGRLSTLRMSRDDVQNLPATTYRGGMARPGDSARSDSGSAAYLVRTELERRAEDGVPTGPTAVQSSVALAPSIAVAVLLVATVITFVV